MTLTDNGGSNPIGSGQVDGAGDFSIPVVLTAQGSNAIVARDTDAAGNTGTSNVVTYSLAVVGPTVTITSPAEASNQAAQTIAGTVLPALDGAPVAGTTLTLVDNGVAIGTTSVRQDGSFSAQITLPNQGSNLLFAVDTDMAGNQGTSNSVTDTLTVPVEPPPPPPSRRHDAAEPRLRLERVPVAARTPPSSPARCRTMSAWPRSSCSKGIRRSGSHGQPRRHLELSRPISRRASTPASARWRPTHRATASGVRATST